MRNRVTTGVGQPRLNHRLWRTAGAGALVTAGAISLARHWPEANLRNHEAPPKASQSISTQPAQSQADTATLPERLDDLLNRSRADLEATDVARVNLLRAEGLPGAETLNLTQCLATLDQWANRVKTETERHRHRFRERPQEFDHSEAYFRMLMMAVVVVEDFGVRYNPARVGTAPSDSGHDGFFADSRDVFLHGLLGPQRMGTCSSMPILYLALGRRLGYPLRLVTTKAHLFLRWEDETERFNLEATGRGMNRYDDEHYRQWPFPLTEQEIRANGYLKSLSAAEELAVFLSIRAECLKQAGRVLEAVASLDHAVQLAPGVQIYRALLAETHSRATAASASMPPRRPDIDLIIQQVEAARRASPGIGPDPNPLRRIAQ